MINKPDDRIGEIIDNKFTLKEVLGEGGMAVVYLAEQHSVGREVAIKLLQRTPITEETNIRRFMREAKAASSLSHRNIVKVFDFGTAETGEMYLVMERLKGIPLRELIANETRITPQRAAHLLIQVCDGLAEAHKKGVIHRDLTPSNIFVSKSIDGNEEFATVLDFGIAHTQTADGTTKLTLTGAVLGTPQYMSPEQTMGEEIGPPSDIYSLGIVLYEMLTGKPPFYHRAVGRVLVAHVTQMPAPIDRSTLPWEIPDDLESLIMNMLAKKPDDRPPTALATKSLLLQATGLSEASSGTSDASAEPRLETGKDRSGVAFAPTFEQRREGLGQAEEIETTLTATPIADGPEENEPPPMVETFSSESNTASSNKGLRWLLAAALLGVTTLFFIPGLFPPAQEPSQDSQSMTAGPSGESIPKPASTVEIVVSDVTEAPDAELIAMADALDTTEEPAVASTSPLGTSGENQPILAPPFSGTCLANAPINPCERCNTDKECGGVIGSALCTLEMDPQCNEPSKPQGETTTKDDQPEKRRKPRVARNDNKGKGDKGKKQLKLRKGKITGFCEAENISKTIRRNQAAFHRCYDRKSDKNSSLEGVITFRWTIDEEGRVSSSQVQKNSTSDKALEKCIRKKIHTIRFKKPDVGLCYATWSFILSR